MHPGGVRIATDFFCCWKNAIMKHPIAQLILVAHAAHGVSVKFFNWEEFFPIEYVLFCAHFTHSVSFFLHITCNFTPVILHTVTQRENLHSV